LPFFFLLIGYKLFIVKPLQSDIKVLYNQEGMLGQVLVTDYPVYNNSQTPAYYMRYLFFNRVAQAWYNPNDSLTRYFPYVNMMIDEIKFNQLKGKALLLGLGGGGVANELIKQNFEVDAIELDPRVSEVATKYFHLDSRVKVTINDGRRYIKNCIKKYNLIVFDVFKGEENPAHMLTMESLNEVKKILTPDGFIVLNGYGFLKGEKGKGMRAIIKTIVASGYKIKIVETNADENHSNTLLFCATSNFETKKHSKTSEQISSNDVPILYDEFPKLEILNKSAVAAWRKAYIESTIKDFNQRSIPLFQ
jgi:SAM-dependent methyltransferase